MRGKEWWTRLERFFMRRASCDLLIGVAAGLDVESCLVDLLELARAEALGLKVPADPDLADGERADGFERRGGQVDVGHAARFTRIDSVCPDAFSVGLCVKGVSRMLVKVRSEAAHCLLCASILEEKCISSERRAYKETRHSRPQFPPLFWSYRCLEIATIMSVDFDLETQVSEMSRQLCLCDARTTIHSCLFRA